jgi:hypothetical protein
LISIYFHSIDNAFIVFASAKILMEIIMFGGLGTDSRQLENALSVALAELKIQASVGKVSSMRQMAAYGVSLTPALIIEGKIICQGDVPSVELIKKALEETKK